MIVRQWVEIQKEIEVTVDLDDIMAEFQSLGIPKFRNTLLSLLSLCLGAIDKIPDDMIAALEAPTRDVVATAMWNQCKRYGPERPADILRQMNEWGAFLAPKHTGTIISAHGVLGRIRDGRYYKELNYGCGEMLRHLEEMAERFYSGDLKAVDEFLQLYDLDEKRRDEGKNEKIG